MWNREVQKYSTILKALLSSAEKRQEENSPRITEKLKGKFEVIPVSVKVVKVTHF